MTSYPLTWYTHQKSCLRQIPYASKSNVFTLHLEASWRILIGTVVTIHLFINIYYEVCESAKSRTFYSYLARHCCKLWKLADFQLVP